MRKSAAFPPGAKKPDPLADDCNYYDACCYYERVLPGAESSKRYEHRGGARGRVFRLQQDIPEKGQRKRQYGGERPLKGHVMRDEHHRGLCRPGEKYCEKPGAETDKVAGQRYY